MKRARTNKNCSLLAFCISKGGEILQRKDLLSDKCFSFILNFALQEEKNAAEAARQAGYSAKTAKQKANTLLKDKVVASCVRACELLIMQFKAEEVNQTVNKDFVLEKRLKILESSIEEVPKMVWDYNKRQYIQEGMIMSDGKTACMVLRDIEQSMPEDKDDKHSAAVLQKLFEILSR